jgi:hypothetical protein
LEKNLLILFTVLFLAAGCVKKKVVSPVIYGLDYYPTTQNKFIVYDIDSIIYTEIPRDTITYRYRIKEKIADSFTDNLSVILKNSAQPLHTTACPGSLKKCGW